MLDQSTAAHGLAGNANAHVASALENVLRILFQQIEIHHSCGEALILQSGFVSAIVGHGKNSSIAPEWRHTFSAFLSPRSAALPDVVKTVERVLKPAP